MSAPKDSQLGAFYKSYMDEARLEQLDAAPLKPTSTRSMRSQTKAEFTRYMASRSRTSGQTLFGVGVLPDFAHPDMNIGGVFSSGMGMPDRDYYLTDKYKTQRDAYRAYIERTLDMIGTPNASAAADQVMAFETEIAKLSWPQADLRDIDKLNNPMTLAELKAYAPQFDWASYLSETKVVSPHMIVGDKTAIKALAELYAKTPLDTLKLWQRFKVADQASQLSVEAVRRQPVRIYQDAERREGAAPALAPRHRRGRRTPRRAARQDLCRAVFPASPRPRWSSWSAI